MPCLQPNIHTLFARVKYYYFTFLDTNLNVQNAQTQDSKRDWNSGVQGGRAKTMKTVCSLYLFHLHPSSLQLQTYLWFLKESNGNILFWRLVVDTSWKPSKLLNSRIFFCCCFFVFFSCCTLLLMGQWNEVVWPSFYLCCQHHFTEIQ